MFATVGGGVFMWAVHLLNRYMPAADYAQFGVFLAVTICVPNTPIQMVFAQQTAKAAAPRSSERRIVRDDSSRHCGHLPGLDSVFAGRPCFSANHSHELEGYQPRMLLCI